MAFVGHSSGGDYPSLMTPRSVGDETLITRSLRANPDYWARSLNRACLFAGGQVPATTTQEGQVPATATEGTLPGIAP
jgi:hypothetical protein